VGGGRKIQKKKRVGKKNFNAERRQNVSAKREVFPLKEGGRKQRWGINRKKGWWAKKKCSESVRRSGYGLGVLSARPQKKKLLAKTVISRRQNGRGRGYCSAGFIEPQ